MAKKKEKQTTIITIEVRHFPGDEMLEIATEQVLEDIKKGYLSGNYETMNWDSKISEEK